MLYCSCTSSVAVDSNRGLPRSFLCAVEDSPTWTPIVWKQPPFYRDNTAMRQQTLVIDSLLSGLRKPRLFTVASLSFQPTIEPWRLCIGCPRMCRCKWRCIRCGI